MHADNQHPLRTPFFWQPAAGDGVASHGLWLLCRICSGGRRRRLHDLLLEEIFRANTRSGACVQATVLRVMDFGAFAAFDVEVAAGGETRVQEVVGLIHRSEMSWGEFARPEDVVQVTTLVAAL